MSSFNNDPGYVPTPQTPEAQQQYVMLVCACLLVCVLVCVVRLCCVLVRNALVLRARGGNACEYSGCGRALWRIAYALKRRAAAESRIRYSRREGRWVLYTSTDHAVYGLVTAQGAWHGRA